jgi:hypothetical protein
MRIVAVIAIGLMLVGCRGRGHSATPDGREFPHVTDAIDRHAPTLDQVGALTFNGTDVGAVTLSGGVWERSGTTGDPDFASRTC